MNYWANKVQNNVNIPPPNRVPSIQMPNIVGPNTTGRVITPPPNANPFQTQSNLYPNQPGIQAPGQSGMLQQPAYQPLGQLGSMINSAYENFKRVLLIPKKKMTI